MIKKFSLFAALMVLITLTGCGVNSNMMFKEPVKDEKAINSDSIPLIPDGEYTISVNDNLTFTLSTNDGAHIIEGMGGIGEGQGVQGQNQNRNAMGYIV